MARSLVAALALPLGVYAAPEDFEGVLRGPSVPLTLLPQVDEQSAACLDGSPYGFYFRPSRTKSTKWTVFMQGGGWCLDESHCLGRSTEALGSSKHWPKESGCGCMNVKEDGTLDDDCNCLYMPYGDGASFSGYRAKPVKVKDGLIYFRGIKNFDHTLDWAFAHGLDKATEFVITGSSAGGLSTFLHADRAAERLAKKAPKCTHIRAAPVVGYFLDHENFAKSSDTYTARMKYVYHMQNLTFGSEGVLAPECQAAFRDTPHYCFMSPHMQQFIKTPFFMFNSKYDLWQLNNVLQIDQWRTAKEQAAVLQYGVDFLKQLAPVEGEAKHGGMITSCICHTCHWEDLELDGKHAYQHYADWYYGKARGKAAFHIDPRRPNGDGTFKYKQCEPFPSSGEPLVSSAAEGNTNASIII